MSTPILWIRHPFYKLNFPAAEYWEDIPKFEGLYQVSTWARVKSLARRVWGGRGWYYLPEKVLKSQPGRWGHMTLGLRKDGRRHCFSVHRLVLLTFVGPCPDGMECCHWDGNSQNNRLENLRWDTPASNHADMIRHETVPRGQGHWKARLTEEQVREIRRLYAAGGITQMALGRMYGARQRMISSIIRCETWRHL